ncbi:MAG: flagellar protein FlgN [Bdellovibrionales bacterium]|nr:flagellar protein FlgN [Bdellovibrionales bacterium]
MSHTTSTYFNKLTENLEDQIKIYRHLLEIVRKEKDILVAAELDELNENNRAKEAMLLKLRGLETQRMRLTTDLSSSLNLSVEAPRLLEIANHLNEAQGDRLRNLHSVLTLLLKRVQEYNKQNETLVNSALQNITGAMNALRDSLKEKPTYERKGDKKPTTSRSGQLVSREA